MASVAAKFPPSHVNLTSEMNVVEKVVKAGLCAGCGVCESIAAPGEIRMNMTAEGYLRPTTAKTLDPAVEANIRAVCPGIKVVHEVDTAPYDPNWGPIEAVNVGFAVDQEVRQMGSSGGVLSALCIHLLNTNQVDFVAQIAVSTSDPLATDLQVSRTREDVIRAAGSRYAPSAPLRSLRALLETGQRFAFVGKPCDIAALRAYLRANPQYTAQIPYLLSFMCAGIPSRNGSLEILKRLGADAEKLRSFRYRGNGWPGKTRAEQSDGAIYEMDYNTSWGQILGKHIQFRCKICADGTGEQADVVCADAWYGKDGYPDFSEREGRSLMLVRTSVGINLVEGAVRNGAISTEPCAIDSIAQMQPFQLERKRLAAWRIMATGLAQGRLVWYVRYRLIRNSLQVGLFKLARNAWGTYRRCVGERVAE